MVGQSATLTLEVISSTMSAKTAPFPAFLHLQSVKMGEGADHNSLQEKMELSNLSLMNTYTLVCDNLIYL